MERPAPVPVFSRPVVLKTRASVPVAVFQSPVSVLDPSAPAPVAVLAKPLPLLGSARSSGRVKIASVFPIERKKTHGRIVATGIIAASAPQPNALLFNPFDVVAKRAEAKGCIKSASRIICKRNGTNGRVVLNRVVSKGKPANGGIVARGSVVLKRRASDSSVEPACGVAIERIRAVGGVP